MHRDDQNTYTRRRRRAMGCDGITQCGSFGDSCDEIPYASTYDGGIGCFAQRWTAAGGNVNQLMGLGSHVGPFILYTSAYIELSHHAAHGNALETFYGQQNVPNFGVFNVGINYIGGCTASGWCNRLLDAIRGLSGESFNRPVLLPEPMANSMRETIGVSQYTRNPRCPSRGYRHDLADSDADFDINAVNVSVPRIFRNDKGEHFLEMFGTVKEGDPIWVPGDDKSVNGTMSKVVNFTTFEEAFGHIQTRQQAHTEPPS
ncbi:hypothetical protein D9758_013300 [Tetrapyrgos nigripes]|uniref:Deoxyribonuclease NucA/NucB domain-containing protein n=1 Tax=Tetrapyrgos nigripes TaxID=182062 RepID=A0A8H5CEF0_9AGAR|nr:hypothetical protein D9758_013300 [Tetrapyrgos nigripes]